MSSENLFRRIEVPSNYNEKMLQEELKKILKLTDYIVICPVLIYQYSKTPCKDGKEFRLRLFQVDIDKIEIHNRRAMIHSSYIPDLDLKINEYLEVMLMRRI